MGKAKIAVTIDDKAIAEVDRLVEAQLFSNRSQAIEEAVREKLARIKKDRLAHACAMADPKEERALAEEGLALDAAQWPEY